MKPISASPDLLPGTLDLLVLKILTLGPRHGYAIARRLRQISDAVLEVRQGSLYPALHRLERQGWIRAKWQVSETGREARYYSLSAAGRRQLAKEAAAWERMSDAVKLVLAAAE
jgi:transcriptional regulator